MFREGDIVEIPLPDGRTAIGWLLHISKHFKNAVGFVVFGIKGEIRNEDLEENPTIDVLGPLYTHVAAAAHYGWQTVAHQAVSETRRLMTKRRVADGVYVADEYLGTVDELGAQDLRPMVVMGMPVVYDEIERVFGKRPSSPEHPPEQI